LLGAEGEQLGIVSSREANEIADKQNLDLVLISPNAEPPVCKIMDYGKYKFEQSKRLKEQKKAQKIVDIKEIQLSVNIAENDMKIKAKHANEFLEDGDKVKVTIRMKGREQSRPEKGVEKMLAFFEMVKENGIIEKQPERLGRNINMVINSVKNK